MTETILLGGGCFWCTEAVFSRVRGVLRVLPGYAGGAVEQPAYRQVCSGETGHIEVVEVEYDPLQISCADLLRIFFATHDPTSLDRQGADVGTQYRSAIFCKTAQQKAVAQQVIQELTEQGVYDRPIVTQVLPDAVFWPAEPEHIAYFSHHPGQGYCRIVIEPKVIAFRQRFADYLR